MKAVKAHKASIIDHNNATTTTPSSNPTTTTTTTAADSKSNKPTNSESSTTKDTPELHAMSEFDSIFQGYFMGNTIANGGSVMDTLYRVPSTLSRLNRTHVHAIEKALEKEQKYRKETLRVCERYADMEIFIRGDICRKKTRIFNQQKHYTKKTMYAEDISGIVSKGLQLINIITIMIL